MENRKTSTKKESKIYKRYRNRTEALQSGVIRHTTSSEVLVVETSCVQTKISGKGFATSPSMQSLKEGSSGTRTQRDGVSPDVPPNPTTDKTSGTHSSQFNRYGDGLKLSANDATGKATETDSPQFNQCADGSCDGRSSGTVGLMHASATDKARYETNSSQLNRYTDNSCDGRSSRMVDLMHSSADDATGKATYETNSPQFNQCADGCCDGRSSGMVGGLMHASSNITTDKKTSKTDGSQFNRYPECYCDGPPSSVADISCSCTHIKQIDGHGKFDENSPSNIFTEKGKLERCLSGTRNPAFVIATRNGDDIDESLDQIFSEKDIKVSPSLGDTGNGGTLQPTAISTGCADGFRGSETCSVPCGKVYETQQNVQDEPDNVGEITSAEDYFRTQKVDNIQDRSGNEGAESENFIGDSQNDSDTSILKHPFDTRMKGTVRELVHYFESLDPRPEMSGKDNSRARRRLEKFESGTKVDPVDQDSWKECPKITSREGTESRLHQSPIAGCDSVKSLTDSVKIHTNGIASTDGILAQTMVNKTDDPRSAPNSTPSGLCNEKSVGKSFGKPDSSNTRSKLEENLQPFCEVKGELNKVLRIRNDVQQIDVKIPGNGSGSKSELKLNKTSRDWDSGYIYAVPHSKQDDSLKVNVFRRRLAWFVCLLSILLSSAFFNVLNF